MDVTIRKAHLEDAGELGCLLREIDLFPAMQDEQPGETLARVQRHLALCLQDNSHSVYVAEDRDGGLVAYISVHWLPYLMLKGPEGFVSELFVGEPFRDRGIGTRLLEGVQAEARQRGCFRLSLENMRGRESYQRRYYEKAGWEERPEAANFVYYL
jgi:GNAT superfamily N-acetyltransferase